LEIAYQFDRYGGKALILAFLSFPWIAITTLLMMVWTEHQVKNGRNNGLTGGMFGIVLSAGLLCLALSVFLPFEPVTAASFQTQSAFGAYLKNAFFYFVPPFLVGSLIPFHLIVALENGLRTGQGAEVVALLDEKERGIPPAQTIYLKPLWLGFLLAIFAVFSLLSSYYLFDHLQPGTYHNLFITLLIVRSFCVFSLCLISLLWYESALNRLRKVLRDGLTVSLTTTWISGFLQNERQKLLAAVLLIGSLFSIYVIGRPPKNLPVLENIEFITLAVTEQQFFINLKGKGFNPETICIRAVGEGCPKANPCLIPNGALKKHGTQSETELNNVPLTLGKGKYILYAQNGDSPFSNGIEVEVAPN
jgi:hypothetical protein